MEITNHEFKLENNRSRCHLMNVAAKLFASSGLDGVSTRDIAKKSKLNISLISYYFGGKESLYKEVMTDFALRAKTELETLLNDVDLNKMDRESFLEKSKNILTKMVEMKFNNQSTVTLLHRELVGGLPHARQVYEEVFKALGDRVVEIFKVAQSKGIMKADINPYVLIFSMAQSVDSFIAASNAKIQVVNECPALGTNREEFVEQIFNIFIRGACV